MFIVFKHLFNESFYQKDARCILVLNDFKVRGENLDVLINLNMIVEYNAIHFFLNCSKYLYL